MTLPAPAAIVYIGCGAARDAARRPRPNPSVWRPPVESCPDPLCGGLCDHSQPDLRRPWLLVSVCLLCHTVWVRRDAAGSRRARPPEILEPGRPPRPRRGRGGGPVDADGRNGGPGPTDHDAVRSVGRPRPRGRAHAHDHGPASAAASPGPDDAPGPPRASPALAPTASRPCR